VIHHPRGGALEVSGLFAPLPTPPTQAESFETLLQSLSSQTAENTRQQARIADALERIARAMEKTK
jgi:hypothetical protein